MKIKTTQTLFAAATLAASSIAFAAPIKVDAPVSRVFVPEGFDDNDQVEVILYGEFPNTCYRFADSSVERGAQGNTFTIDAQALSYEEGEICAQVLTPYIKPVALGLLEAGSFDIQVNNSQAEAALEVNARATESPDDYLYAPVTTASLGWDADSQRQLINLKGVYPEAVNGECTVISEVRVNVTQGDVIVVQPIMSLVTGSICDDRTDRNFDESIPMEMPFNGTGLLHVRVMNGNSLNSLVQID